MNRMNLMHARNKCNRLSRYGFIDIEKRFLGLVERIQNTEEPAYDEF